MLVQPSLDTETETGLPSTFQIRSKLRPFLMNLSEAHEYDNRFTDEDQSWISDPDNITSHWTLQASVLYAMTVITTTGVWIGTVAADGG